MTILSRSAYAFVARRSAQATDQTTALLQKLGTVIRSSKQAKEGGGVSFVIPRELKSARASLISRARHTSDSLTEAKRRGAVSHILNPTFLTPHAHTPKWRFRHKVGEWAKHETCATEQPGPLLRCAKAQPIRV